MAAPSTTRQRAARLRLADLFAYPRSVFVVHYACESFDPSETAGSPRVIAIAIRNLGTAQALSFSIHEEIELTGCPPDMAPQRMDELEYRMLAAFYRFLASNKTARFVHWNMRDAKFGFEAIAHRFAVLGGDARRAIPHVELLDLAMTLGDVYGHTSLPRPHFEKLAQRNGLSLAGFLAGADEPRAFREGNYRAVRDSVLSKVSIISQVAELAHDNVLKTDATWWDMNYGSIREVAEMFHNNPVKAWVGGLGAVCMVSFTIVMRWLA